MQELRLGYSADNMSGRITLSIGVSTLLLLGCGSQTATPQTSSGAHLDVSGARVALLHLEDLSRGDLRNRPSALLGLYVADYLGEAPPIPFTSAMQGLDALQKLSPTDGTSDDETFTLLQAFGTVLKVDIQDEMNRSQDRPATLNTYMDSLTDITDRSKAQTDALIERQKDLDAKLNTERRTAEDFRKKVNAATKVSDFAQAGEEQKHFADSQAKVATLESNSQQTRELVRTFQNLLVVADKRKQAIDQNREIIISGLKVVDVPGIEDLGILKQTDAKKKSTNNFFGF